VGGVEHGAETEMDELPAALSTLLETRGGPHALLRTLQPLPGPVREHFQVDDSYRTFFLDLRGGSNVVWKERLASKVRRQTRRGFRMDLECRTGHLELFEEFYEILSRCWRDLGTPFHAACFFRSLLEIYGPQDSAIMNLYKDGVPISTALLLVHDDTVFHPYTGTIKTFQRGGANNVLYWKIIEWGCDRELKWFDMGRSREDQSTARYKRPWGVEEHKLYYNYFLAPGESMPGFLDSPVVELATRIWKHLPVALSRRIGPPLIRRVL